MADYRIYDVTVSTLTPLHIGSGRELLNNYDYAVHRGRTWRIDETALLDAQEVDDPSLADRLAQTPPAQLLRPEDFRDGSPFFRYVIQGTPRSVADGAQLREQIKDAYDRVYLPGSSLKGALRTAIAWDLWRHRKMTVSPSDFRGKNPKTAASPIEQRIFGDDSNHDFLRVLQIADSELLSSADNLQLVNAVVLGSRGAIKSPIDVEAIRSDTNFHTTIKVDQALYSSWAKNHGLDFPYPRLLTVLPSVVQRRSTQLLTLGHAWAEQLPNGQQLTQFFQNPIRPNAAESLGKTSFLLQLGWGTGWTGMTLGTHLQADRAAFDHIISRYQLNRVGRLREDGVFPTTRRVSVQVERDSRGREARIPHRPFGWCLVEMKERT